MPDEPLIPYAGERHVAEVVDLAEVRVRFGMPRNRADRCEHKHLVYSQEERRIWCEDCERSVDNFDAFMTITNNFQKMAADVRRKNDKANEALSATLIRRAAKEIDRVWGHKMVPCCPMCHAGLFPEDFANGASAWMGRDYALGLRKKHLGKAE